MASESVTKSNVVVTKGGRNYLTKASSLQEVKDYVFRKWGTQDVQLEYYCTDFGNWEIVDENYKFKPVEKLRVNNSKPSCQDVHLPPRKDMPSQDLSRDSEHQVKNGPTILVMDRIDKELPAVFPFPKVRSLVEEPRPPLQDETNMHDYGPRIFLWGIIDNQLPEVFPFPERYSPLVEATLKLECKELTRLQYARFITDIAKVLFEYKTYPKAYDYESVAKQSVVRYPCLSSHVSKHSHVAHSLKTRLKEFRRPVKTTMGDCSLAVIKHNKKPKVDPKRKIHVMGEDQGSVQ